MRKLSSILFLFIVLMQGYLFLSMQQLKSSFEGISFSVQQFAIQTQKIENAVNSFSAHLGEVTIAARSQQIERNSEFNTQGINASQSSPQLDDTKKQNTPAETANQMIAEMPQQDSPFNTSPLDPQILAETEELISSAIDSNTWEEKDAAVFNQKISQLPYAEQVKFINELSSYLNTKK